MDGLQRSEFVVSGVDNYFGADSNEQPIDLEHVPAVGTGTIPIPPVVVHHCPGRPALSLGLLILFYSLGRSDGRSSVRAVFRRFADRSGQWKFCVRSQQEIRITQTRTNRDRFLYLHDG